MNQLASLFLVLLFASAVSAQNETPSVQKQFEALAKKYGVKTEHLGVYATVGEDADRNVLLDVNSSKIMIPASITKIATASAVLANFPPGYKFKTQLLASSEIKNGVLQGDLYLKGGGDPGFVSENMWFLVNAFLRNKITKIQGNIVVDDSLFDDVRYDSSRQKTRVDRAYDAPVGAMSFNWNSINIFARPTKKGQPAEIFVDPENDYIRLVNRAKTSAGSENVLLVDRKSDKSFPGDVIHVSGAIGASLKEVVVFKNITSPDYWSGYNLKSFLAQRGISVSGAIKNGMTPAKAQLLAESESKPVEQAVADLNKFSNNYVAEMLTKNLGALKKTSKATLADGMLVINEHMQSLGVPADQYQMQSPSGLSQENKMSSFAVWKVLQHLRNDFKVQPEFLSSLPIAGIDGTLKRRMKNTPAERWVRAKTGYINNVVSLAGYAGLENGEVITFSLIYNGPTDEGKVRTFFDNLMISLVSQK